MRGHSIRDRSITSGSRSWTLGFFATGGRDGPCLLDGLPSLLERRTWLRREWLGGEDKKGERGSASDTMKGGCEIETDLRSENVLVVAALRAALPTFSSPSPTSESSMDIGKKE